MPTVGSIDWDAVGGIAAILAVLISLTGLLISIRSSRGTKHTREGMVRVQQQMADALGRVAEAQEAQRKQEPTSGPTKVEASAKGGTPSVRLVRQRPRSENLQIRNIGPGPIEIVDLQVLGQPEVVVHGGGDPRGAELLPGEEFNVLVALTLGTQLPLEVLTKWRDDEGVHDRVQRVSWS